MTRAAGAKGAESTAPEVVCRKDGTVTIRAARWRMTLPAHGQTAFVHAAGGGHPVELQLAGALDRTDGTDETLETGPVAWHTEDDRPVLVVPRRSTVWREALTRVVCTDEGPEISWEVAGRGLLRDVLCLAVRAAFGGRGGGLRPSGHAFSTLFSPNPGPPRRLLRGAGESAVIGVVGDARPGRGHWFFTPAPLCLALSENRFPDDTDPARARGPLPWWTLSVGADVRDLTFTQLHYVPSDGGLHLRLEYEGHTEVDGRYRTPAVLVSPGHTDPYAGLHAHRRWLEGHGWAAVPYQGPGARPLWWSEPMFCGWGAQMARTRVTGVPAPDLSTQAEYDAHLEHLREHGLDPGTVVVDDKWQRSYGHWEPDEERWPDLRGWIERQHARGRRVLLWWKAWSTEGVPEEWCVRTGDGRPVTLDPGRPDARALLAENVRRILDPDGLNADGLKVDFTADTPTGEGLTAQPGRWGIALLHQYLAVLHRSAKQTKPDALVVTHTPHPAFADVTDMVRLNDMLRLDDPDPWAPVVPQMRMRAAVAAAACPDTLIDTDDWCAPDREQWRAYTRVKDRLGVPALYVSSHLDRTGEPLEELDYAALRELWSRWRARPVDREKGGGPWQAAGRSGASGRG
ncbi:hypothetical protein AB0O67_01475 [Streptomyces sp. NPDC086077]|uniref:hypothetical protein n=1 Tax=Streptomyces sp. NPDC086077 TaxID=3154862 RepID=UPI0034125512